MSFRDSEVCLDEGGGAKDGPLLFILGLITAADGIVNITPVVLNPPRNAALAPLTGSSGVYRGICGAFGPEWLRVGAR